MFELTPIVENEACSWENVTVVTGSYAFNVLETGAEDNVMWGELEDTVWVGLNVGSAISVEVM
jgi:hypothetical protein